MPRLVRFAACLALFVAACDDTAGPGGGTDGGLSVPDASAAVDAGADANASDAGTVPHDAGAPATDAGPSDAATTDAGGVQPGQSGLELDLLQGRARGVADGDLRVFKGIPFAEPPVGPRRFAPPVPAGPWTGTLDADEFGPGCAQAALGPSYCSVTSPAPPARTA